MKITATACKGSELRPGDLFSVAGPAYWDNCHINRSVGEKVWIRTAEPADSFDDAAEIVYKISISTGPIPTWQCENCKVEFKFLPVQIINQQPDREHPLYCPYCGNASIFDAEYQTTFKKVGVLDEQDNR